MRRAILWFHRWTGILLAVYLVVIGISGAALVFQDEASAISRIPKVTSASGPLMDADAVANKIRKAFPAMHLHTLYWPENLQSPWFAEIKRGEIGYFGEDAFAVYLHPTTGEILHVHNYGTSVWRMLQVIHINLVSGRTGRFVNSVLALVALFSLLTGIYIWWGNRILSVQWAPPAHRLVWQLHQVAGIYGLPFLLLFTLTGASFGWRGQVNQWISHVFPMAMLNKPLKAVKPVPESQQLPIAHFLPSVKEQAPNYPVTRVLFPETPNQPIRFVVYEGSRQQFYTANSLFYDAGSGELLRADLYRDQLFGDRFANWIAVAHFGTFSSFFLKLLWALGGLILPLMAATGVLFYVSKVRKRASATDQNQESGTRGSLQNV